MCVIKCKAGPQTSVFVIVLSLSLQKQYMCKRLTEFECGLVHSSTIQVLGKPNVRVRAYEWAVNKK